MRGFDGFDDLRVASTAAEVAAQRGAYLLFIRVRVSPQERRGGHQHAGGAETALDRAALSKRTLDSMHIFTTAEAFNGRDVTSVNVYSQHQTRKHGIVVQQDRACAALAHAAAVLGARQRQLLAEYVHEKCIR
jgi:hypothetical protein